MEEKIIKSWLDIAPAYLSFILNFFKNPNKAFSNFPSPSKISHELTSILVGGIAFSYIIILTFASPLLKEDPSSIVIFLKQFDYHLLPVISMIAVIAFAIPLHLLGKLYSWISKFSAQGKEKFYDPKLGGSLEDTVNAALGFASAFIPLISAVLCIVSWLPKGNSIYPGIGGLILALLAFIYFPLSISSTHPNTGFLQALLALCGASVLAVLPFTL
jgi:hypothetical protein